MKTTPFLQMLPDTYERICREWTETIKLQESGTWIWPPLNGPYRRIWQFQRDLQMQQKLLGDEYQKYIFVHIDLEQKQQYSKLELYELISYSIATQTNLQPKKDIPLLTFLDATTKALVIAFLVTGIDASIRNNNWNIVDELCFLAQRNWNTQVLLFVETDITHPNYLLLFNKKTTLAQNITITPLYSRADARSFIKFVCFNWSMNISKLQEKWILDNCCGHYLLVKDAIRQIRKNPILNIETLAQQPSMQLRAESIIANLLPDQREILALIVQNKKIPENLAHSLRFLVKQGWLLKTVSGFDLTVSFLAPFLLKATQAITSANTDLIFTKAEKQVFDHFKMHPNTLVSRDDMARLLWAEEWENHYSDWAIDQIVHRLREKIANSGMPYELKTKKGQGFALLNK